MGQVHILARHGYFKNSKDWMSFQLYFVDHEQVVDGNCAVSQSLQQVIPQHRTNAQMARDFYIGEVAHRLMTHSQLNDIAGQLVYYNQLRQTVDIPEIKLISANYERTITSATCAAGHARRRSRRCPRRQQGRTICSNRARCPSLLGRRL